MASGWSPVVAGGRWLDARWPLASGGQRMVSGGGQPLAAHGWRHTKTICVTIDSEGDQIMQTHVCI